MSPKKSMRVSFRKAIAGTASAPIQPKYVHVLFYCQQECRGGCWRSGSCSGRSPRRPPSIRTTLCGVGRAAARGPREGRSSVSEAHSLTRAIDRIGGRRYARPFAAGDSRTGRLQAKALHRTLQTSALQRFVHAGGDRGGSGGYAATIATAVPAARFGRRCPHCCKQHRNREHEQADWQGALRRIHHSPH
jgi:hypothetical protein